VSISTQTRAYASPVDYAAYGHYGPGRPYLSPDWGRPIHPFRGRVTADGSSGFRAEPGRYHLYAAWVCPYAQRAAIVRKLKGLEDVVSLSYVDDERDGRGWAFRERRGADPVNGFTLLEQAYEATEKGYGGHISVPVLWDRRTGAIVSNNFPDITIDLATQFEQWAGTSIDLYPDALRPEIDKLNGWIYHDVNTGVSRVARAAGE
jgi:glutathione S-transferase/putative glutathione S-transferase